MIQNLTKKRDEDGFTLIELLVVIVILGILAAVVVFAVGGITDKGQTSACEADKRSIQTAQEAYFAQPAAGNGKYAVTEGLLVPQFLAEESDLHNTSSADAGVTYTVTGVGKCAPAAP